MTTKKWVAGTIAVGVCLSCSVNAWAHESEARHRHLSGTVPPLFENIRVTWYQDILYDDSSADTSFTSLDLYAPDPSEQGSPVLVYVHGGAFSRGDKADPKELDPKPGFFTHELGFLLVSINYRLLPEGRYPTNAQDVANALAWVHAHIGEYGGDPDQIFLMGFDVGAVLIGQVATDESFLNNAGAELGLVKGVILIEGAGYDLTQRSPEGLEGFFGPDPEVWTRASSITHVARGKNIPPFLFLHVGAGSSLGGVNSRQQSEAMAEALRAADIRAETVPLWDKEHYGANEAIGEPGEAATIAVRQFLESLSDSPHQ